MNIKQAIESGRPFRRKSTHVEWLVWHKDLHLPAWKGDETVGVSLPGRDLIANDWETQEPTITITSKQFWDAYKVALVAEQERQYLRGAGYSYDAHNFIITELAKGLGLGS